MYLIKTSRESDGWNPSSLKVCSKFKFCLTLVYVKVFGCYGERFFHVILLIYWDCVKGKVLVVI